MTYTDSQDLVAIYRRKSLNKLYWYVATDPLFPVMVHILYHSISFILHYFFFIYSPVTIILSCQKEFTQSSNDVPNLVVSNYPTTGKILLVIVSLFYNHLHVAENLFVQNDNGTQWVSLCINLSNSNYHSCSVIQAGSLLTAMVVYCGLNKYYRKIIQTVDDTGITHLCP